MGRLVCKKADHKSLHVAMTCRVFNDGRLFAICFHVERLGYKRTCRKLLYVATSSTKLKKKLVSEKKIYMIKILKINMIGKIVF